MKIFKDGTKRLLLLLCTKGVLQTAPSYELSRKYPRYWGSPKMNIFRIRNETMIATTPHQGGPADRLLIWALSEIPPILGFTKNDTFSNKENFVYLVLGCINDFLSFVFSSGRRASKYYPWASPERQIQPKKAIFRRRRKPRPPRARTRISLETFSL